MSTADAPVDAPVDEWNTLPWQHYEQQVFKLQKRISQASRRDDRQLLHGHCHDAKTAMDGNRRHAVGGATVTGYPVEEPDEVKVSRPVL